MEEGGRGGGASAVLPELPVGLDSRPMEHVCMHGLPWSGWEQACRAAAAKLALPTCWMQPLQWPPRTARPNIWLHRRGPLAPYPTPTHPPPPPHALPRPRFEKVEQMRAEVRRKELLERKLKGEVEEEEVEGEMVKEEAKIDETEDAGGWRRAAAPASLRSRRRQGGRRCTGQAVALAGRGVPNAPARWGRWNCCQPQQSAVCTLPRLPQRCGTTPCAESPILRGPRPAPRRLCQGGEACAHRRRRVHWLCAQPAHPRRHGQVPAQPRCQQRWARAASCAASAAASCACPCAVEFPKQSRKRSAACRHGPPAALPAALHSFYPAFARMRSACDQAHMVHLPALRPHRSTPHLRPAAACSLLRPQVAVDARGPQPRKGPLAEDLLRRQLRAAVRRGGGLQGPQRLCHHHPRARTGRAHAGG